MKFELIDIYKMKKNYKKGLIIISSITFLLLILALIANLIIKNKIENRLLSSTNQYQFSYSNMSVNSIFGNLLFENPVFVQNGKTTKQPFFKVKLESLSITDLSYWEWFFNEEIQIGKITINSPEVTYFQDKNRKFDTHQNSNKINKNISAQHVQINNGNLRVYNTINDSLELKAENIFLNVDNSIYKGQEISSKIPITFDDFQLDVKQLFYSLNSFENLNVASININSAHSVFKNVKLKTKHNKTQFYKILKKERDHFELNMDSLVISEQDFGFRKDFMFYFTSGLTSFYKPEFEIFRDKLLEDDLTKTFMYSEKLRDLNFNLDFKLIKIHSGLVKYLEKTTPKSPAGALTFKALNADITNLGNAYKNGEKTSININSVFMKTTPLVVNWEFDVSSLTDRFTFKGTLGDLPAEDLNMFMKPNVNIEFKGQLYKTYFTIDGNNLTSQIDLKTKYDAFEVIVLNKAGEEKNKFLSSIVNLFIAKNSNKNAEGFRSGYAAEVKRDQSSSVFNFLWLNLKAGLLSAIAGNGEKQD